MNLNAVFALILATGLLTSAAPGIPVTYCPAVVLRDYELAGISYYAQVLRDASCMSEDLTRIRKTSTLNQVKNGAPYQPILPLTGAWTINNLGKTTIPRGKQWTLYSWKWQWYDGHAWKNAVTQ